LVTVVAVGAVACGGHTKVPVSAKARHATGQAVSTGESTCASPQWSATVDGTPDITTVPAVESVTIAPNFGGLLVSFRFSKAFVAAPEGVFDAWTVYLYHHRSDAPNVDNAVQLQIEDRGKGWEPTGWTLLASLGSDENEVAGQVHTNKARNEIQTFFPAGFANLSPPFYWFATQEEDRAYMPRPSKTNPQDFSVYGTITAGCPNGVVQGPFGIPDAAKLIKATD
jgi:hypothetical protein